MRDLFVSCPHGFEPILEKELRSFGIAKVFPRFCGALIPKTLENAFAVNYLSRIATRVLWPIAEFPCRGRDDLYTSVRRIPWGSYLRCSDTFAIDANVQHPELKNSLFAALVVKDGICDFFRDKYNERPSVDVQNPDIQFNLFIQKGQASLYLDTSGAPLYKRGWRTEESPASLHETLAASLLMQAGYTADAVFCDPFCGSGTFLIEAGWIATKTPPGILRKKWGFFHLPGFRMNTWKQWKAPHDAARIPLMPGKIFGADKSRESVENTRKHLRKADLDPVTVSHTEIALYTPPHTPNFMMTNPPYGKRLETSAQLFSQIEEFLQKNLTEGSAHILCPEELPSETFHIPITSSFSCKNGGLPIKVLSFERTI